MNWKTTIVIILFCMPFFLVTAYAEPLKVCLVSGSAEYDSDTCLTHFKKFIEENYDVKCTLLKAVGFHDFPGLEALETCDTALLFTRRLVIDGEQLDRVKKYFEAGKPAVALRTASHGFQNWLALDKEVLGGNYQNHFGNDFTQKVTMPDSAKSHPILNGVEPFWSPYSLYRNTPIAEDTTVLLESSIPNEKPQPSGWTREHKGGRIFYSSLGGLSDFDNASFLRMVTNALFWSAKRDVVQTKFPKVEPSPKKEETVILNLRSRLQAYKASDDWQEVFLKDSWKTNETAIIICDMWDRHGCKGAMERCEALAIKMNPVIKACREHGIQIIHAPSETMGFYAGTEQRLRILQAPVSPLPEPKEIKDAPLPIDDSDGGCDTDGFSYQAWSRQSTHIEIGEYDVISDQGKEIYSYFQQQGIKNVIMMGVHTNMCILNRSFAIKEMSRWGLRCVLVRDLTDAMYDPKDPPKVSHERGTGLVIEHIEKYWCPTILSGELAEGLKK